MPVSSRSTRRIARPVSVLQREKDREVKLKIEAHIPANTNVNDRQPRVTVEIRDGFVTLSGKVRTYREKERLHKFVMRLQGVRALKDLIKVEPLETLADREVALMCRQVLDAHSELPSGTISVFVRDGICTLKGYVNTAEERHIAHVTASHTRGVKKVVNALAVNPLDEVSDLATVRAVKSALNYCTDFDIRQITVSCADGNVVLRGLVPSMMDRTLAEEVARIQNGVRAVENHIQVATHAALDPVTVADNARRRQTQTLARSSVRRSRVR